MKIKKKIKVKVQDFVKTQRLLIDHQRIVDSQKLKDKEYVLKQSIGRYFRIPQNTVFVTDIDTSEVEKRCGAFRKSLGIHIPEHDLADAVSYSLREDKYNEIKKDFYKDA